MSSEDVMTRLAGAELLAYQQAALASGQADPLAEILSGQTFQVPSRSAYSKNVPFSAPCLAWDF